MTEEEGKTKKLGITGVRAVMESMRWYTEFCHGLWVYPVYLLNFLKELRIPFISQVSYSVYCLAHALRL